MLQTLLLVVHVLLAIALIALVLVQHGKGADMGAAFGSGASGTVFGSSGSGNFMTRLTAWIAAGFVVTSLSLATLAGRGGSAAHEAPAAVPAAIEESAGSSPSSTDLPQVPVDAVPAASGASNPQADGLPVVPE